MKLLLITITAALALADVSADCGACVHDTCYTKHYVMNDTVFSDMALDTTTNTIYFTSEDETSYNVTAYNLRNKTRKIITHNHYIYDYTVNENTGDIYVTLKSGIYKLNPETNEAALYGLPNEKVFEIEFREKLYYTCSSQSGISTFENGVPKKIIGTEGYNIKRFIVDKHGDIYFTVHSNMTILQLKKGAENATLFTDGPAVMVTDNTGEAFFFDESTNAVYKIDYDTKMLVEVGATSGRVSSVVFDGNNDILYSDGTEWYHLKRVDSKYARCSVSIEDNIRRIVLIIID